LSAAELNTVGCRRDRTRWVNALAAGLRIL
jgi:hypothetical protein